MKRDLDLIRDLLIYFEREIQPGIPLQDVRLENEYDPREILGHIELMIQQDLILGICQPGCTDLSQSVLAVEAITWSGHDFLDASRNETVWRVVKQRIYRAGGWTVALVLELLKDEVKKRLGELLP